LLTLKDS